jgi:tetratricopeptide (TPR) repeat protein
MAPQTVIRLSERSADDGKFGVRVNFGGDAEYDVDVTDPADDASEQELAWYFEEHLRYPFLDKDRERDAVQRITAYGTALFGQVFGGDGNHDYRKLREQSFDRCRVEVSGSAALHRLHWEALRDPDYPGTPLAVRMPVTRRVEAQPSKFAVRDDLPTLNILVVTARPGGSHDVGYRTISRPLLDALRTADQPVTVDLVRPGRWDALRAHLAAATRQHGSGWYQVIHFDLHGAFTGYAALAEGVSEGELLSSPAALPPFDGQRGFLFFETERDGIAHPVPAETVASLLAEHRIPVAVLNACQSAMQTVSEAGLAQRLAEAGVPVTVGMAYSVTVTAAEKSMPVLYEHLSAGADPVAAVHAARSELFEHRGRRAYFDQQLDLEDWMLPVVFGQRPLQVGLRAMTGAEQAEFFQRSADVGDEPATEYGFVGRDLDIQAIERRLLAGRDSNELLVRGMAGAGKSTLLHHLAWWWQRTGLVAQAFRFSYEDRAWTAHQIVRDIRAKLFTPAEHAAADSLSEAAQTEQVAQRLRAQRHLLILDNAESITAAPASIPHALSAEEQAKFKTLLSRLRGGHTLVLLGSRESEDWLTSGSAGPGIYPLPGLDPQASSVLVDRILARHNATRHLTDLAERMALEDLVKLLGGYPLPLTVVLPVLATTKPSEVLKELREGGPGADPTGLIHRAIEYSHGRLDESLQNSLLLLAPFTSHIATGALLDHYQELLLQDEAVQALGQVDLTAALGQAISVGLAEEHSQFANMVQVQPVLPYFLQSRLHGQPALRAATDQAHYLLYCQLAPELYRMLMARADPQLRAIGLAATKAEYANITAALAFGLRTNQRIIPLARVLGQYLDQSQQQATRLRFLLEAIVLYGVPATQERKAELTELHFLAGIAAYDQHNMDEAAEHLQAALRLSEERGDRLDAAHIHHELGMVAAMQRNFKEAEAYYRESLEIKLEFGDKHNAAQAYLQLGIAALEQNHYDEAEASQREALKIFEELGDRRSAAKCYHELGIVAHHQGQAGKSEECYRKALAIKESFHDRYGAAITHYQLGMLLEDNGYYAEAEAQCRLALSSYLDFGDRYRIAMVASELGRIAYKAERLDEAEANWRKALDIYLEFGDKHTAAIICSNLGELAWHQSRTAEAEVFYAQALDAYREFGDVIRMSHIAAELGRNLAEAGRHRESLGVILGAALFVRQEKGRWPEESLQWIHRERGLIEPDDFAALLRDDVPAELAGELTAAIDAAGKPGAGDGPGAAMETSPGDKV